MFKVILYTIAVAIFSTMLIVFSYGIAHNIEIPLVEKGRNIQQWIIASGKFLGDPGSWIVGVLATGACVVNCFLKYKKIKSKASGNISGQ